MGGEPDRDPSAIGHGDAADDETLDDSGVLERLGRRLAAGARGLLWVTTDEDRAIQLAEAAGDALDWPVHTVCAANGVDNDGRGARPLATLLRELLDSGDESAALWVVLDGASGLADPASLRLLRVLAQRITGPAVLLVEPRPPPALSEIPELVVDQLAPPSAAMLSARVATAARALSQAAFPDASTRLTPAATAIARAALGLPQWAFDRLLAEAVLAHGASPEAVARYIGAAKPALLDRGGLLEVVEPVPVEELGGLAQYKQWLARRALSLTPAAAAAGIAPPRGVLLLGVQGCGKSLAAQASAALLGLPLVRLEPGRLFGGTLGQSEANLRRVTALVDRLAPIVLWLDELDKGLAGADGSSADGGTTSRVVGSLLTWLEERRAPVFVAATANRVDRLPPELLRRGRLDEIFFVDLPDASQRAEIMEVHLLAVPQRALGRVPPMEGELADLLDLARRAEGFSGAELQSALTEARLLAFADDRPLSAPDLAAALAATIPLSRTRSESIGALRAWADGRARQA